MTEKDTAVANALAIQMLANAVRRLDTLFPGYFPEQAKHDHYKDFGYPKALVFQNFYDMYRRNGVANAGVDKTVGKVWQDFPFLLEREDSDGETPLERDIRERFNDLRIWQRLREADKRSMVGAYSGVILRRADNKRFNEPVDRVPGGLKGLVEIIPAWEGQLKVSEWDTNETSENYGQPLMFQFIEAEVQDNTTGQQNARSFDLHPDRVIVWSEDGSVNGSSALEPGYNDLITIEKIIGAGGEGFWKNAKSAPVLQVDPEAKLNEMARMMGVPLEELVDKMNDQVEDWQKGFDKLLMVQGMEAKTLGITLPSPEHFFAIALQSFAASIEIPMKILVGSQTGERASTEDAREWAQTCMSRRSSQVVPNIMQMVNRLERFGILPEKDWFLSWQDLTEPTKAEKFERALKMAETNQKMGGSTVVFTDDEIRAAVDLEPLTDSEKFRDELAEEETTGAIGT
ncbi:DUF1073 domain-containing protein [Sinorhizobium meliloti]|uniref:anti-CBASS protein Acb1 family protein n=1 Tax=Rhizobium meliloti TaxID=382 RepID=UPI000B49E278|nr:anti-CBASS Acb1 family protein [Sinorhizobium meliloti]ASP85018.1 DUF1073 domain-containing protein [Sinorhizobium meliloti]MQW28481.1 DUF1073 domain-containing protein [Sinorhizobium meliloti]